MPVSSLSRGEHRQIAMSAKVETTDVERYLSGKRVSDETKNKIEAAMKNTGFDRHIVKVNGRAK